MKKKAFGPLIILTAGILLLQACRTENEGSIDRYDLVNRHRVVISQVDSLNSLTVGNGDFAFTVDITGLQSFPEYHASGIPLGTFSNWCWHSDPNPEAFHHGQTVKEFRVGDRDVPYYHDYGREKTSPRARASGYLRQNPHRMNMGLIGLKILDEDGRKLGPEAIGNPRQVLDLWKGEISSDFEIGGIPVSVKTVCHPEKDMISCSLSSELLKSGRIRVELRFPEADRGWKNVVLWGNDAAHKSGIIRVDQEKALISHSQDSTQYVVDLSYRSGSLAQTAAHSYELTPGEEDSTFSFSFASEESPENLSAQEDHATIETLAARSWEDFWTSGGAVDFSACKDERAFELERRVILSRYLMQVQCSGSLPPQETGLTFNSWFGKMHLEMHWWHGVHFALWQQATVLEEQMQYYEDIREQAAALAGFQGYGGARWPKMVGPDGLTSPSTVGNYLIWQQPHYIYFAELLYKASGQQEKLLQAYSDLVFQTAAFMASYPVYDETQDRYVLGPALIPAQETFHAESTINPSFELSYWYWALGKAMEWKERLGEAVPPFWREVHAKLSDLPVKDSVYLFTEDGTDSYTNDRYISDHPAVLACLGMLPETDKLDREIMRRTFDRVVERWNWPSTWGWDYPVVAMTAAELGLADEAIHFLLLEVQKNTYLRNGHNYQDERLPVYLPGNGGLLTAVARMCARDQFPKDGNWDVRWENLLAFE